MSALPKTLRATRLPTFLVGGAPTSGTTSLHHYLAQHPQIFMSPIKEPTFFGAADMLARPDFRPAIERDQAALKSFLAGPMTQTARYWVTERTDYEKLFRNAADQPAIGESSASYLWLPSAAPAIRTALPDVKIVFLLRDPADRLFSWHLMSQRNAPQTTFRDWLLAQMRDVSGGLSALHRRLDGGLYATHLRRFFEYFPREQVRVYTTETFRTDTSAVLRSVLSFIGVDASQPIDVTHQFNETFVPRFPFVHRLRQRFLRQTSVIGWLPATAQRSLQRLYRRPRGPVAIPPDDRQLVIDYYRDDILRTQDLIGMDLSAWLR